MYTNQGLNYKTMKLSTTLFFIFISFGLDCSIATTSGLCSSCLELKCQGFEVNCPPNCITRSLSDQILVSHFPWSIQHFTLLFLRKVNANAWGIACIVCLANHLMDLVSVDVKPAQCCQHWDWPRNVHITNVKIMVSFL